MISFGIIGGGWRAEFYIRIARALPEAFRIHTILVRNEEKARELEARWGIPTVRTLEEFLAQSSHFSFAVLSVTRQAAPSIMQILAARGIPILAETPPAAGLEELIALYSSLPADARIQVAEQYLYQPMHAARIRLARSKQLGEISHVQVSVAHDYHGISLIRQLLGIGFEQAVVSGQQFHSKIIKGPGRMGDPDREELIDTHQQIATLRFGSKLAVYDFTRDQYFSWIRRSRILVRGSKGEIVDEQLSYLQGYNTPIHTELRRVDAGRNGNLEGFYHRGIMADGQWLYRNPTAPARLSDEEIAIATCLMKMGEYAEGRGPSFYSLADAAQDHYLALMTGKAIETGETVITERQIWAREDQ